MNSRLVLDCTINVSLNTGNPEVWLLMHMSSSKILRRYCTHRPIQLPSVDEAIIIGKLSNQGIVTYHYYLGLDAAVAVPSSLYIARISLSLRLVE